MKDGEILVQTVKEGKSFTVTVGIDEFPVLDDDFVLGFAVQIQDQSGNIIFVGKCDKLPIILYTLLVLLYSAQYPQVVTFKL